MEYTNWNKPTNVARVRKSCPDLDKSCVSEIRNIPPDCGVVNVQEEIVVIDVHSQLKPLDQLVMADQVVEESPSQVPVKQNVKCLSHRS